MGRTTNGDNCGQYANTTNANAFWALREVGGGYYQLQNQGTGLYLDGVGRTTDGAAVGQYAATTNPNSHWAVEPYDGDYYRIRNRSTSLYLDGVGRTTNGADVAQYANTTNTNAQWSFGLPAASAARTATTLAAQPAAADQRVLLYPNPVRDVLHIGRPQASQAAQVRVLSVTGQLVRSLSLTGADTPVAVADLPGGLYLLEVTTATETTRSKFVKE
ncbi:MAG: T9SS type A sorting domain-containing protein, partial [Cytophagaceae bacterium]